MPPTSSPVRKRFRQFLLAVAVLHGAAIAGYYLLGVPGSSDRFQRLYAWVWMGLTVALVIVGLQRIKRARFRPAIRRPAQSPQDPERS